MGGTPALLYSTASIRRGPRAAMAEPAWASKSAIVSAREASTPMPPASRTQSSSGLCRSSIDADRPGGRAKGAGEGFQAADAVLVGVGEMTDLSVFRQTPAGLAGKGEERHRRLGADQDQDLQVLEDVDHLFGEIGNPLDPHAAGFPAMRP